MLLEKLRSLKFMQFIGSGRTTHKAEIDGRLTIVQFYSYPVYPLLQ